MAFSKYVGKEQREMQGNIIQLKRNLRYEVKRYHFWAGKRKQAEQKMAKCEKMKVLGEIKINALKTELGKKMEQNGSKTNKKIPKYTGVGN